MLLPVYYAQLTKYARCRFQLMKPEILFLNKRSHSLNMCPVHLYSLQQTNYALSHSNCMQKTARGRRLLQTPQEAPVAAPAMDFFYNKVLHLLTTNLSWEHFSSTSLASLVARLPVMPSCSKSFYFVWDNDEERNASNSTATHLSSPPKRYHS